MTDNVYIGEVKYVFLGTHHKTVTVDMPVEMEFEGKPYTTTLTWELPVTNCTYEVGDRVAIAWKELKDE